MTKSNKPTRRSGNKPNVPITTQATANSTAIKKAKSPIKNRTATAVKKDKKAAAEAMVSPSIEVVEQQLANGSVQLYLSITTNSKNQDIVSAPLSVPLSDLFLQTADFDKADLQGYIFQNCAFESDDDKDTEKLLKAGAAFMECSLPSSKDWHYLFSQVCEEGADLNDFGVEMLDFCLNLAASDPLELFAPGEMETEGNLFYGHLPAA